MKLFEDCIKNSEVKMAHSKNTTDVFRLNIKVEDMPLIEFRDHSYGNDLYPNPIFLFNIDGVEIHSTYESREGKYLQNVSWWQHRKMIKLCQTAQSNFQNKTIQNKTDVVNQFCKGYNERRIQEMLKLFPTELTR